jgi:hypothetical protein
VDGYPAVIDLTLDNHVNVGTHKQLRPLKPEARRIA